MTNVMFLQFRMQEENALEHIDVKCHLCTLWSTRRPLWNMHIHPITLLDILVPRY